MAAAVLPVVPVVAPAPLPVLATIPQALSAAAAAVTERLSLSHQQLSPADQQRKVMGIITAFAAQRGVKFVRYEPALHDNAIFRSTENWCEAVVPSVKVQALLMQLRDEMKYVGETAMDQALLQAWRTRLSALGLYNVGDPRTHRKGLRAWVLVMLNPAQKSILPTAEVLGLAMWHDLNMTNDWAFCSAITEPSPLITRTWKPVFTPEFANDVFSHVPKPLQSSLFNSHEQTVEIAYACGETIGSFANMELQKLLMAFALASNNVKATKHSALIRIGGGGFPGGVEGAEDAQNFLRLFGFGHVTVATPVGQAWYVNGDPGRCEEVGAFGKFAHLALDPKRKNGAEWFLLTPVEAALILDLTKSSSRGISCVEPGSVASQIGFDPRTGRVAYPNDSDICESGQFNFLAADNLDRSINSLGQEGTGREVLGSPYETSVVPPPSFGSHHRRSSRGLPYSGVAAQPDYARYY